MKKQVFEAKLTGPEVKGSWTYFYVPFKAQDIFGKKGQVKVKGTINGISFRSSLLPTKEGEHYMVVNRNIRDSTNVKRGDYVKVEMELDTEPRVVEIPAELKNVFKEEVKVKEAFEKMSYSHQKEYIDYIIEAKKEETKLRRVKKTIELKKESKTLK